MPRALVALALLSLSPLARCHDASPPDLPAGFVATRLDAYLQGMPKRVITGTRDYQGGVEQGIEDKYDKGGLLVSHMVSQRGEASEAWVSYKLNMSWGRLREVMYTPSRYGSAALSPNATVLQYDDQGRALSIVRGSGGAMPTAPDAIAAARPSDAAHVTLIRYEPARQVHEVYVNRAFAYREAFDFGADGHLLKRSCLKGNCGFIAYEYGPDGLAHLAGDTGDTRYDYQNHVLVAEIHQKTGAGELPRQRHYQDYQFDACGNWTRRQVFDGLPGTPGYQRVEEQVRKIEYYGDCPSR